jgi:alpha-beta hydrolase superfamily lysophospholipase
MRRIFFHLISAAALIVLTFTPGKPNAPETLRPKMGQNAELGKALAAKMPDASAEVIPNAGHLVFLEAPLRFNELMLAFLAK